MSFADRLKFTVTGLTSAASISDGAAVTGMRNLTQAVAGTDNPLAVGITEVPFVVSDASGKWQGSYYTIGGTTQAPTLTLTRIVSSSNAGAAETFSGTLTVLHTELSDYLNGQTVAQLTEITTVPSTYVSEWTDESTGSTYKMTFANLMAQIASGIGATDTTAPTFVSAQVANSAPTVIQVTMSEALGVTLPATSAFSVSGSKTVSSVAISGSVLSLTCSASYAYGDTITVIYTKPGSGNLLQDTTGNATVSFGPMSVTNNIANPGDTIAPTASSAAVANATPTVVAITMSEAMSTSFVPAASAFTVSGHTVSSVAISGSTISLTVSAAFVNGEAARTVAYTQPGTNNARDVAGNLLANFSALAITNNVAASGSTYTFTAHGSTTGVAQTATANADWVYFSGAAGITDAFIGISPVPPLVAMGWGPSSTAAPAYITSNTTNTGSDVKIDAGYMGRASGFTTFTNGQYFAPPDYMWVRGVAGTYNKYLWVQPLDSGGNPDGPAHLVSSSPCTITVS